MSHEQISFDNRSAEEIERDHLQQCFYEGICPHCGSDVDDLHANDHLGFCNEGHLHGYQVEHSTDVRLCYKQTHSEREHEQYLEDVADELAIPVALLRKLHDEEQKSIDEIRSELALYEDQDDRKAA